MTRFIRFILSQRALVAVLLLLSLIVSIQRALSIRVRFQFRDFYDYPENQQLPLFKLDLEQFGDPAGYVAVLIEADDVFRRDVLEYVERLTRKLEPAAEFSRIRSLSNAHAIRAEGDGVVSGPLLSPLPDDPATLKKLRQFALDSGLLRRRLISPDGKTTAVLAELRTPSALASTSQQRHAIDVVRAALDAEPAPTGVHTRLTGAPAVEAGVTEALIGDQLRLMPAVLAVLALVLFLTFRSLQGILLCLSAVGVATLWTAGLFTLLDRPVDLIGSVIPTTILVYGVVDPIFVLARVQTKLELGLKQHDAIVQAFAELGLPCFLTSLTTSLGFAAFVTERQLTIRYYGLTVAVGVLLAWLTTITVLPLLLSVVALPKRRLDPSALRDSIDRALAKLWEFLRPRRWQTIAVSVLLLLGFAAVSRHQRLDNVYAGELPRGATRDDVRQLERQLAGVLSLSVHLQGSPDSMKRPEVLDRIAALDGAAEKQPLVTVSSSLADLVAEANQAFHDGDPSERRVPNSRRLIAQYLAMVDARDRAAFVTEDYSESHVAMLLADSDSGSERTRGLVAALRRALQTIDFEALGVKATITGLGVVGYDELDQVVRELLYGFINAFAVIVMLQWLVFRSLRLALISIIPNLLPVAACFLTLRLFDLRLGVDTALVLCISVGGLFNTTIHFSARVRQLVAEQPAASADSIILSAIRAVGPPALFTATALSAGFAVLLLSSFPGLEALGLLSMVTLVTGFFSDMIVTAVLLRVGFDWNAAADYGASAVARLAATRTNNQGRANE